MANSVDADQILWHLISIYTVCNGLSILILRVITVNIIFELKLSLFIIKPANESAKDTRYSMKKTNFDNH